MKPTQLTRRCPRCETVKSTSEFYAVANGFSGYCKPCQKDYDKSRPSYRDEIKAYVQRRKEAAWAAGTRKKRNGDTPSAAEKTGKQLYHNAFRRAALSHREMTVTPEQVIAMVQTFYDETPPTGDPKDPFRPSLDRIDPLKGYTPENTRVVWLIENYARNHFSDEVLEDFCRRYLAKRERPG